MSEPGASEPGAAEVYEIVVESTAGPRSWWRSLFVRAAAEPAGAIVLVIERASGRELFRHIEDLGDDEDHLVDGLSADLGAMTAAEFASAWLD